MTIQGIFPFTDILRAALGSRLAPGAARFVDMFAEDGVFEFPYAPPGGVRRLQGREAIAEYVGKLTIHLDHVSEPTVRPVAGGDAVVLEFECRGRNATNGAVYEQRYVSVIEMRGGRIALYRDYWNPLPVMAALGGQHDGGARS